MAPPAGRETSNAFLVLQHISCEPPAAYEDELRAWGVELHRVEIDEGEPLPDWREFAGIVAMGGPMGAYEDERLPWLTAEKRLIAEAVADGRPYWGVCLGAQLLAASLGARVYPGPVAEVGVLRSTGPWRRSTIPCSRRRHHSSMHFSGTPTRSTCPPGPYGLRALTHTSSRHSCSGAPTRSSSTLRSMRRAPPSGETCRVRALPPRTARPRRAADAGRAGAPQRIGKRRACASAVRPLARARRWPREGVRLADTPIGGAWV